MLHSAHNPQPGVSVRSLHYVKNSLDFVLKSKTVLITSEFQQGRTR